uniref:Protein kinase domain-containing protein n=1 Tax=Populus trichocarpa TaxID=3694 RepID=U7E245_POPTR
MKVEERTQFAKEIGIVVPVSDSQKTINRKHDGFFFAVKEVSLLDQGSQGKQSIYQLEQEIALLSRFEHENIVQYYGTDKSRCN